MGIFKFIKSAFNSLFHIGWSAKQYDCKELQSALKSYPQSLPEVCIHAVDELADGIEKVYATANKKEFTIGVIGDFTVGKSSFVNAILGSRFLPVSVNPSTAIITKIKYGKKKMAVVRYSDGTDVKMDYDEYQKFSAFSIDDFKEREATGKIKRFDDVIEAELYVQSDFLKENNLCIVDTLGLSADEDDNKKTIDSIRDAVVVIYVCGERGLTQKDCSFISDYLGCVIQDSFVCINRIDLVRNDERDNLLGFVRRKLNSVVSQNGLKEFPEDRIYQVSSLFQEFANGFKDHESWREGVDYSSISGFAPIIRDLGIHIGEKAKTLRDNFVTTNLKDACRKVSVLRQSRQNETGIQIGSIDTRIKDIRSKQAVIRKEITHINGLFEGLEQKTNGFLPDVYPDFVNKVESRWDEILNSSLMGQTHFGVGDYLALEKDVAAVKINVFVSNKDKLYAGIGRLDRFVNPTIYALNSILREVISQLNRDLSKTIGDFAEKNSFGRFFGSVSYDVELTVMEQNQEIRNEVYRAAASAGVESTWVSNNTRMTKMFNAAKNEYVRLLETPLGELLRQCFESRIQSYLNQCNKNATAELNKSVASYESQVINLENQKTALQQQLNGEIGYFDNVTAKINDSVAQM